MWSLTSDRAHCVLKLVIIKRPTVARLVTYERGLRGPRRAAHSDYGMRGYYRIFGHTHNSVTSSTMVILREVLPTA
jgi:hypothetical protein